MQSLIKIKKECVNMKVKFCPNCGSQLEENTKFCGKCGMKINNLEKVPDKIKTIDSKLVKSDLEKVLPDNIEEKRN